MKAQRAAASMRRMRAHLLAFLAFGALHAGASPCAANVSQLRLLLADPDFPLSWRETSMDDGRPLMMSIGDRDGALFLSLTKSGGLWVEGPVVICARGGGFEARFSPGTARIGPAAHWALRHTIDRVKYRMERLGSAGLRVAAGPWSGVFSRGE